MLKFPEPKRLSEKFKELKEFFLEILFPRFCVNCQKEGEYLCPDCLSLIDILLDQYCPFCRPPKIVFDGKTCIYCRRKKKLSGLFCAASYENFIIKKLIWQFKYPPYVKDFASPLSSLIISHLNLSGNKPDFSQAVLIPIPLAKKQLKKRGFNQAEELAKELSLSLEIPLLNDVLFKIKETLPQMELSGRKREENIKGAFSAKECLKIRGKKILLVDDVFTTGATMEECAKILKASGAKEVWGMAVARG